MFLVYLFGNMITPSETLRKYIEGFESFATACKRLDVAPDTLRRYLNKEQGCASSFIESVKKETGFDFEKAFEVIPE